MFQAQVGQTKGETVDESLIKTSAGGRDTDRARGNRGRGGARRGAGEEAQHPVHHGRRHRLDAAEHLPSRLDGWRNTQHRPHRAGRREVCGLRGHAELHLRAQRLLHRHVSAAHGHDPAAAARQPVLSAARHPGDRQVPARSRLHHRRVRQEPPGRPHRGPADGARLPGVLGLSLPPGRGAAGELSRHQQQPDRAGRRPAVQEHADPRHARGPRRRRPQDDDLPDAAAARSSGASRPTGRRRTRPARTRGR